MSASRLEEMMEATDLEQELEELRREHERVLTELVIARRWVAMLAEEVEGLRTATS